MQKKSIKPNATKIQHDDLLLWHIQPSAGIQQLLYGTCACLVLLPVLVQLRLGPLGAILLRSANFAVTQQLHMDLHHCCLAVEQSKQKIHVQTITPRFSVQSIMLTL